MKAYSKDLRLKVLDAVDRGMPREEGGPAPRPGRADERNGDEALAVGCDVANEQQAHDLIERARDGFGHGYPEFAGVVVGVDNGLNEIDRCRSKGGEDGQV